MWKLCSRGKPLSVIQNCAVKLSYQVHNHDQWSCIDNNNWVQSTNLGWSWIGSINICGPRDNWENSSRWHTRSQVEILSLTPAVYVARHSAIPLDSAERWKHLEPANQWASDISSRPAEVELTSSVLDASIKWVRHSFSSSFSRTWLFRSILRLSIKAVSLENCIWILLTRVWWLASAPVQISRFNSLAASFPSSTQEKTCKITISYFSIRSKWPYCSKCQNSTSWQIGRKSLPICIFSPLFVLERNLSVIFRTMRLFG